LLEALALDFGVTITSWSCWWCSWEMWMVLQRLNIVKL